MLPRLTGKAKDVSSQIRTYAVSISSPRVYPGKQTPRQYSGSKFFRIEEYTRLLKRNTPILFLSHNNFSVKELIKLRRDIASLKPPPRPSLALAPAPAQQPEPLKFSIVNTTLLGVALRDCIDMDIKQKRNMSRLLSPGPVAVLTMPDLNPPQLRSLMRLLDRAIPKKKRPPTPEELKEAEKAAKLAIVENPTPGRRPKRFKTELPPELELKGALIEGRLFVREQLGDVASLPTLDTLRAQLLGLISAPASQLAGVLNAAAGGQLARTLEGFRKGLEMESEEETSQSQS